MATAGEIQGALPCGEYYQSDGSSAVELAQDNP
jgi:hypothetical protein